MYETLDLLEEILSPDLESQSIETKPLEICYIDRLRAVECQHRDQRAPKQ